MSQKRLAALDIGTNSIRCIIVEVDEKHGFRVLDDEKASVRLGEGLSENGRIASAAWSRALEALQRMRKIIDGLGVIYIEAVATSAVRKAENGNQFVAEMKDKTGIDIRVIGGHEEAALASLSALHHFDMYNTRYVLIDIGGGSIEVITAVGSHIEEIHSLELGAVFLTERFLRKDPIPAEDMRRLRKHLCKCIRKTLGDVRFSPHCLIGSGGTITNIGSMVMARRKEQYDTVHAYDVLHSEVVHQLAMLQRKSFKERRTVSGLNPERADIIVAGVAAVDALMRHFDTNLLKINAGGIREGLIIDSLKKHGLWTLDEIQRDWLSSVIAFARSCHADETHGHQVRRMALEIFDSLPQGIELDIRARMMLEAAAILHDVGYFISYDKHHKHSYHLIRHANLFDFTPRETEIIANLSRYHRKSMPKTSHDNFSRLTDTDQQLVRKLGGILRLADGLDRRRSNIIKDINCDCANGKFIIEMSGHDDMAVEIYGAKAKSDLFELAFDMKLVFKTYPLPKDENQPRFAFS
ncbi:MAG: Ppx/GppA family phosphatase [Deltaproteobacteria bacterium]|jgi:exopolyphosphatase/guanosine-5'-triphosphate,3'-diphosphate pyrophosphatase|nr:Ppx/GppA family phosphatase [Deltaproteobacteria bacterium]